MVTKSNSFEKYMADTEIKLIISNGGAEKSAELKQEQAKITAQHQISK